MIARYSLIGSRRAIVAGWIVLLLFPAIASAQSFTHVHLRTPDPAAAAEWYHRLLGGTLRPAAAGMGSVAQIHGSIATMFDPSVAEASAGSVIDHFGFAVADVADMVARAQIMGAQVELQAQPGTVSSAIAMIQDPWGTNIELLEDPEFVGLQHVHLVAEHADALRDWLLTIFGGTYDPELGGDELHAIRYDGIWVYLSESPDGATAPSRGRSLDHIGFSVTDMNEIVRRIEASGYHPYEIRPNRPGGTTLLMFFEGAGGIHFEIAEPGGAQ